MASTSELGPRPASFELDDLAPTTAATSRRASQPGSTTELNPHSTQADDEDPAFHSTRRSGDRPREFPVELPPMDGGIRAWSFLAAVYVLEVLVWGLPLAAGSFLEYYQREVFPDTPSSLLPLVASLQSGLSYCLAFPTMSLAVAFPKWRKPAMYFGLLLSVAGLLGASFSTTPVQLLWTQGFLLSVGGSLLYWPVSTFLWEWFEKRKGLAVGVLFSGTGLGGFVLPLIVEKALSAYGYRITLQGLAVAFVVMVLAAAPLIKGRVPDSIVSANRRVSFNFTKKRSFWFLLIVSIVQGCGNFMPALYLPTYAASALGLSPFQGTLVLALLNASQSFGYPLFGYTSDKHHHIGIISSSVVAILAAFFLWGFATSYATLIAFALVFGFVSPSYGAFWSTFTTIAQGDPSETILLFSVFVATRGAGNLASGPLAAALLKASTNSSFSSASGAYGLEDGRWGATIVFTGACATVGMAASLVGFIPKGRLEKKMMEDRAT